MAERQQVVGGGDVQEESPPPSRSLQILTAREDMIGCVVVLEATLLPCLPARELQAIDRSPHPSHQSSSSFPAFSFENQDFRLEQLLHNLTVLVAKQGLI